jgi:hypothetical protein
MSDEPNTTYERWALKNWKVATCIAVALAMGNVALRMLVRPPKDLPIGPLGYVEIFGGWLAIVFWFNAVCFGQRVRRDNH